MSNGQSLKRNAESREIIELRTRLRKLELIERYWSCVESRNNNKCWPWTGHCAHFGHGIIYVGDAYPGPRRWYAHRVGWSFAHEKLPPAHLVVRHACDNPPCQNPAHLVIGTHADNMADMVTRGRTGYCGHPGEQHPSAKLTTIQVAVIRARYAAGGVSQATLGREFGISQVQIGRIISGQRWSTVGVIRER